MGTGIHAQASGATPEPVALRPELPAVALFAVQFAAVFSGVGTVQSLVAEAALEAALVPFAARGEHFLRGVHGLLALGTFGTLGGLEGHVHRASGLLGGRE